MHDHHEPYEEPAEEPARGTGSAEENEREQDVKDRHLGDAAQHIALDLGRGVPEGAEGIHPGYLHSTEEDWTTSVYCEGRASELDG